ncbi:hypothetical protein OGAPHI_004181 [Ogataea philodendri]|uniref:Uncharacterized protein n=1 Tax=Ogataea philodendri TaxID=1378263 RepID=A0A9P8P652_9ASCO|nr:uncharacterized protein OGAPHI_004181 [Ogataea philodendri]KAH3665992.1 hypothetical protein OGAPHI_004181 [Ogataea philodendri]
MSEVISLLKSYTNNAADGTGIVKLVDITKKALHLKSNSQIPSTLVDYVKGQQQAQFGSYPDHKDVAPSSVFTAVFFLLMLGHLYIFTRNSTRGHWFPLSLAFAFYCLLRLLGFALRIAWAKDILRLHVGIASEVLLILPTVFLASFNLVLAQRIFTWKHPVGGNCKPFWYIMLAIYSIVAAVVIMTIVAGTVPYLYLLSQSHYDMCRNVVKATSIMICIYSVLAILLVLSAFLIPSSSKDRSSLVFQPFWIKSFSPTYFVDKHAAQEGRRLFVLRHGPAATSSKRTILRGRFFHSDTELGDLEEFETSDSNFSSRHNSSISLIALTSICVLIGAMFRCVGLFLNQTYANQSWIFKPVVMYMFWGYLETAVNVLYLYGRVDLRFYRPDRIPKSQITKVSSNIESSLTEDKRDLVSGPSSAHDGPATTF